MTTTEEYLDRLHPKDRQALQRTLRAWVKDGVENPLIPLADDVNEDGLADAWGLDEGGELTVVLGVHIDDTVFETQEPTP